MNNTKKSLYSLILLLVSFLTFSIFNVSEGKNFSDPNTLKIVQLTDVHLDTRNPDVRGRLLSSSSELLSSAITQINSINDVDLVVFSGDMINHPDKDELFKFIMLTSKLKYPWLAALGNHDIGINGGLSKNEYMNILSAHNYNIKSQNPYYYCIPKNGYIVIFLDGVIDSMVTANGYYSPEQLTWLDKTLSANKNKKAILVQHFPVIEPIESHSHKVLNASKYLDIISKHSNVVAVISGHYHVTKVKKVNNVLHISTPALIEYPDAFRVLTFRDDHGKTEVTSEVVETSLKDLAEKSRNAIKSPALSKGGVQDRNFIITLDKLSSKKLAPKEPSLK